MKLPSREAQAANTERVLKAEKEILRKVDAAAAKKSVRDQLMALVQELEAFEEDVEAGPAEVECAGRRLMGIRTLMKLRLAIVQLASEGAR